VSRKKIGGTANAKIFELGHEVMNKLDLFNNEEALELISSRFRMLSEPTRLRILGALGDQEMTVTELVAATGLNQGNISKHLGALLQAGIVTRRKAGLTANYRISDPTIFELCNLVLARLQDDLETRRKALANIR
jgi:ArsR family transcriptional regulator